MRHHPTPFHMSLYKLLDDSRYVGCVNSRERCACFSKREDFTMSLLCRETDEGLHLVLKTGGEIVPANQYPLPDYLIERINFWNTWASDEFLYQYERIESPLYGLEAYAISIAADISACFPNYFVDYCGFPVHDEWATREYALMHSDYGRNWYNKFPQVPTEWSYNSAMKKLVKSVPSTRCEDSPYGYVLRHDLDWGMSKFHYDPSNLPEQWLGYEDSLRIDAANGYPGWLVRQRERMEIMHDIELEDYRDWRTPAAWRASEYIHPFLFDAMSVDILRFSKRLAPISSSPRYVTGSALIELVKTMRTERGGDTGSVQPSEIITTSCPKLVASWVVGAAETGNAASLRKSLDGESGRWDVIGDFDSRRPIHYAAKNGHLECIKVLLEYGADIHSEDIENETAITLAAFYGHTECVRYLLEQGANVNDRAVDGTPLIYAAQCGNEECVRMLLERGASVNESVSYGKTALKAAVRCDSVPCVRLLVEHGAKVTETDHFGFDEMMLAVQRGNEECIQLVLAAGGNPEYVGKQLETSLFDAVNGDNVARVRELLKQGADVNFRNPEGETALFRALQYGTACDCLPDILAAKPDETIRNTYGRTAWECAKLYGPLHGSGLTIEDLRNMPFAEIEENDAST